MYLVKLFVKVKKLLKRQHVDAKLALMIFARLTALHYSLTLQFRTHMNTVNALLWMPSMDLKTIILELTAKQTLRMTQVQTRRLHSIKSLAKINVMQEKLLTLKHVHVNLPQRTYATLTVQLSSLIHLSKIHTRSVSV